MGISGLLPFTKSASTEKHIKDFKGQTVAVDSYCWLHKGAFGCADKLAMGERTNGYISYCFKYIDMLQTFKVKPIMVFDGQHLPAKLLTEKKRRETRKLARKRATECLKLGNMTEARNNFKKCVDITPEMAFEFIKECRRRNIDCIVAPYEADAQLAYLNQTKLADFVISEDSDLLAFGCSKVLFKLDLTGRGILVESDKLHLAVSERPENFTLDKFRHMCILSGCDYLDSLPGVGLKKALKFIKAIPNNDNIYNYMVRLPHVLNMQLVVTKEYRDQFMIADATFRHQLVFDVIQKKLMPLTDPEKCGTNLEYCCNSGKMLDDELAYQIAVGNYNPFTHEKFSNWTPQKSNFSSIWCRSSFLIEKPVINVIKKEVDNFKNYKKQLEDDNFEENLINLYRVTKIEDNPDEPPAKKVCIHRDIKKESPNSKTNNITSPVLTGRKRLINPFLKKKAKTNLINILSAESCEETLIVSKYFSNETSESSSTRTTDECSSTSVETKVEDPDNEEELSSSLKENENTPNDLPNDIKLVEISPPKQVHSAIKQIAIKCRKQGLTRPKNNTKLKPNKNQPTLLSMFGFSKK